MWTVWNLPKNIWKKKTKQNKKIEEKSLGIPIVTGFEEIKRTQDYYNSIRMEQNASKNPTGG